MNENQETQQVVDDTQEKQCGVELNAALSSSFMLVHLHCSLWSAKVNDKRANEMVRQAAGSTSSAGQYLKYLFAGADTEHGALCKAIRKARQDHYSLTQPWSLEDGEVGRRTGARLLANARFFDYTKVMQGHKVAVAAAKEAFKAVYNQRREDARVGQGTLWNPAEYPSEQIIDELFGIDVRFDVVPDTADFVRLRGIPDAAVSRLATKMREQQEVMVKNAMADVFARAVKVIDHMATTLADPAKSKFHGSLVENVRDCSQMLKDFNIVNDSRLEAVRQRIEDTLIDHDAKKLKADEATRARVAADATAIVRDLKSIGVSF